MFRIFSTIILLAFFIWILPLGAFIKISQEGRICGGQRAICLCSVNFHVKPSKSLKPVLTNVGQVSKESSSGGANREFSIEKYFLTTTLRQERFTRASFIPAATFFIKFIEHVPKV